MDAFHGVFPPGKPAWTGDNIPDLAGKVFIVTGGNGGIGKETVKQLLQKNGRVYMASRSRQRAEAVIAELTKDTGNTAIFLELDLANLASVKRAAAEYMSKESTLNTLFNNGGVMATPMDNLSADGYDLQFGTNVLGHFYFTKLLLPVLFQTYDTNPNEKPRIITTCSDTYQRNARVSYDTLVDGKARRKLNSWILYCQSKFGTILMSNELARRYGDKIVAISLHPGVFATELQKNMPGPVRWITTKLLLPLWMGALTQLYAGTSPEAASMNGKYLVPWSREGRLTKEAKDVKEAAKLWNWLEEQVARI